MIGGLIGGIASGGKGAAIGAGAGTRVQVFTKGPRVHIPPEARFDFSLTAPVKVTLTPEAE